MSPKNSSIQQQGQGMDEEMLHFQKKLVLAEVNKGVKLTTFLKTLLSSSSSSTTASYSTLSFVNQILSCFENAISALKLPSDDLPIPSTSPNQRWGEEDVGVNEENQGKCVEEVRQIKEFEMENVWVSNGMSTTPLNNTNVSEVVPSFTYIYDQEFAFDPLVWDLTPSSNNLSGSF